MTLWLTRRAFLKLGGAAALGLALPRRAAAAGLRPMPHAHLLGRTTTSLRYYQLPTRSSPELGYYVTDAVIPILEQAVGEADPPHNPLWLRTNRGWVHSSFVQPVRERYNEPILPVPAGGFLAEVTVPFSQAWDFEKSPARRTYRLYYASTYWVDFGDTDSNGVAWYRIYDDLTGKYYFTHARDLRRVPPEELTPLSAGVGEKRIQVDLAAQRLTAFEGDRLALSTRISTGVVEGDTPRGEFRVERKRPSRHMAADDPTGAGFDLPGVPWVCFISWTGVSLHGTYWHNDYGRPRSHGCINLSPFAAKWLYRWTEPVVPPEEDHVASEDGTRVVVF